MNVKELQDAVSRMWVDAPMEDATMTVKECLERLVVLRQQRYESCVAVHSHGAMSEAEVDDREVELVEAKLELARYLEGKP